MSDGKAYNVAKSIEGAIILFNDTILSDTKQYGHAGLLLYVNHVTVCNKTVTDTIWSSYIENVKVII